MECCVGVVGDAAVMRLKWYLLFHLDLTFFYNIFRENFEVICLSNVGESSYYPLGRVILVKLGGIPVV
jgi:hypothetical protein